MKTIYHFIAPLLALITMVACAELEVSESTQNSNKELLQELSITGKDFIFDGETRSTVTIGENGASFTWDEDDVIGIFPDKGDQVSFAMDEGAGTQTATFSGGGWALKSSAKYAAYYPHVYENRDLTAIPVSYVGQAQNGNANTDHIGAYDFMAAGVSTPENGAVAFDMQHLGALVQLSITVPEPSTITKVVLTSSTEFTETGTIDLTANIPTINADTQSNTFEIALDNVTTTETNETVIVYFMTAPVDLTDSDLSATIHFADETINEVEITGKNFQAGKAYRLAVEIPTYYIDEYGMNHGAGVRIDGVIWAPVNCGYHPTDYPYGKLYQWGRKYGQGYSGDLYDENRDLIGETSDAVAAEPVLGPVNLNEGQSESNSQKFYYSSSGDWLITQNNNLWSKVKTDYDPCPSGWRVPTYDELNKLSKHHSLWTSNDAEQPGCWLSGTTSYTSAANQIFLPAAGGLSVNDGSAYARGQRGFYWSSWAEGAKASYLFIMGDSCYMPDDTNKAVGMSVRCVKI